MTFNAGVEAGQLLFVAAVLALYGMFRRARIAPPQWVRSIPAYAIGGVAAFWLIERTIGFWNV